MRVVAGERHNESGSSNGLRRVMNYLVRRRRLGKTSCEKIAEYSTTGLGVFRNDAELPEGDLVFRWGCTSNLPTRNVVNTAQAIHLVSDKMRFRKILDEAELCPKTWTEIDQVQFPCVVRPQVHHQGRNLFVCYT